MGYGVIIFFFSSLATKQVGSGEILIWDLGKHVEKGKKEVAIEPLIKLKYPQHNVKYLNLGYSNGEAIVLCHISLDLLF